MARKWGKKAKETPEKDSLAPDTLNVEDEDTLTPEDIENMSDEEFNEYLESGRETDLDEDLEDLEGEEEKTEEEYEETDLDTTPEDDKAEPETKAEPFKTFETEADYEAEIEKRVNEAMENQPKSEDEEKGAVDRIRRIAKKFYGESDKPLEDIAMELEKQYAEQNEIDVDKFRTDMANEEDAEKWRSQEKEKADKEKLDKEKNDELEKGKKELLDRLNREARDLKFVVNDFDFAEALKEPEFVKAIKEKKSVAEAYSMIAKKKAEPEEKDADGTSGNDPVETIRNSAKGTGGGIVNPAKLSSADFKKYIDNIKNGY